MKVLRKTVCVFMCAAILFQGQMLQAAEENDYRTEYDMLKQAGFAEYFDLKDTELSLLDTAKEIFVLLGYDIEKLSDNDIINQSVELGLIKNTALLRAKPQEPITEEELVYTALRALNWESTADKEEAAYLTLANRVKLLSGLAYNRQAKVTGNYAAKLLYNLCRADYNSVQKISPDFITYVTKTTLLEQIHNITTVSGTVVANQYTGLYSLSGKAGAGRIKIGGTVYRSTVKNISSWIGYRVEAWVKEEEGEQYVVAVKKKSNQEIIVINCDDIEKNLTTKSMIAYYNDDDRLCKNSLADGAAVIFNTEAEPDFTESTFEQLCGTVTIFNDDSGKAELVIVEKYDEIWVEEYNMDSKKLSSYYGHSREWKPEETEIFFEDLTPAFLIDIKARNVLSVIENKSGTHRRVMISQTAVTGKITTIQEEGGKTVCEINGEEYTISANYKNLKAPSKIDVKIGMNARFSLNIFGEIAGITQQKDFGGELGYVVGVAQAGKGGISPDIQAKIFGTDGKMHLLTFADKVKFDSVSTVSGKDIIKKFADTKNEFPDNEGIRRQPIIYKLSSTGMIQSVDLPYTDAPEERESAKSFRRLYNYSDDPDGPYLHYRSSAGSFSGKVVFSDDVICFQTPPRNTKGEDADYRCMDKYLFKDDEDYMIEAYSMGAEFAPDVIVNFPTGATFDSWLDVIVDKTTQVLIDGDEYQSIACMKNATSSADAFETKYLVKNGVDISKLSSGDYVKLYLDYNEKVTSYSLIYDYSEDRFLYENYVSQNGYVIIDRCGMYTVASANSTLFKCMRGKDGNNASLGYEVFNTSRFKSIVVYETDTSGKGKLYIGSAGDIRTYENYTAKASRIIVTLGYGDPWGFVVYNAAD